MSAGRWLRGAGAAAALVGLVVAVPWALVAWGHWPITGLPSLDQLRDLPAAVASDSAIIGAFTVALWVAWVVFVACLVAEIMAEVSGREASRVAAVGPIQRLARHLVATVAMTVGWLGPLAGASLPPLPARPAAASTPAPSPAPKATPSLPQSAPVAVAAPAASAAAAETTVVVVRPGDNPWALAQEHLADGARWTEIWDLNRGAPQPDGRSWESPETIMPGWHLTLPAGGDAVAVAASPGGGQVMVQPDDNPWSLAETHLGDGKRWRELFDANRGRIQPDGDAWLSESLIQPGWILDLPDGSAAATPAPPASETAPAPPTTALPPAPGAPEADAPGAEAPPATEAPTSESAVPPVVEVPEPPPADAAPAPEQPSTDATALPEAPPATEPTPESRSVEPAPDGDAEPAPESPPADATPAPPADTRSPDSRSAAAEPSVDATPAPPADTRSPDSRSAAAEPSVDATPAPPADTRSPDSRSADATPGPTLAPVPDATTAAPDSPSVDAEAPPAPAAGSPTSAPAEAPSPPSPPTTGAEPTQDPVPSPRRGSTDSEPSPAAPAGEGHEEVDLDIAPLLVAGIPAVLAAGIVWRLDRLRRRRARRRPRGGAAPVPPAALQATERQWRAIADHESADWVDTAVRYLTWAVRSTGAPVSVVGVRTGPHGLELLLSEPARQGAPRFAADESGWQWRLKCPDLSDIRGIAAEEPPYTPGLVTLGTADDGSTILVDVEQFGLTSVEGDEAVVRAWLSGVALDVATAPWAGEVDLRLVGGLVELAALEQVALLDLGDVPGTVEGVVADTTRSLGLRPSTQAARGAAGREPWPPLTVVISTPGADQPVVDATVPARGAAVVAAGPVPRATVRLVAGADGYATLYPYGLSVRLSGVDARTAGDTARLLTGAAAGAEAPAEAPAPASTPELSPWPAIPSAPAAAGADEPAADGGDGDDLPVPGWAAPVAEETADVQSRYAALIRSILEPGEVEVVVLGSPQVTGWEHEPRQRSVEIVCYLAVHDGAITGDRLRDAVFPPGFKATSLRQAVSRTRTALGRSSAGYQHILPAFAAGSYELGPAVRSDYRRFQALVAAARRAPADCEIKLLRTALGLVRSQPFSDTPPGGYGWASAEGISYALERMITEAAHRLGELALAADDPRLAEWAARQGQRAVPGHEGLFRDLAMAKLHQGDVDGFMAVRREAEAAATTFDALDALQPETQEFFTTALAEYRDKGKGLRRAANDH
jgi:nucleoid-associated protein YgaU